MSHFILGLKSLLNRRLTASLTLLMVALSICLLLSVDRIRLDIRSNFANTISNTDLIIGARTGQLNLLLYSVFRIGDASNNITWKSYQDLIQSKEVAWSVPLSLGDSHKGYVVLGTTQDYFTYYQYANHQPLQIVQGKAFNTPYEVVLGSEVAQKMNYQLGDSITLSHGTGSTSFEQHDDRPFRIVGVLAQTGTPIDRTLHIPLAGMSALHINWKNGVKRSNKKISPTQALNYDLTPKAISAALVGMNSKIDTFRFQRTVNKYSEEPLMAIIPGAALQELWQIISSAESALFVVSVMVVISSLLGMMTVIYAGLNERRREIAIYRALGSRKAVIYQLLLTEAFFYGVVGTLLGAVLHYLLFLIAIPIVQTYFAISLSLHLPDTRMYWVLLGFIITALMVGFFPSARAYRQSLVDGLKVNT